jgi:hypothetical protein
MLEREDLAGICELAETVVLREQTPSVFGLDYT